MKANIYLLLFFILIAAIVLRLHQLDTKSIDILEHHSISFSAKSINKIVKLTAEQKHGPVHFILLHIIQKTSGNSEIIMRLPSFLAGIFSILLLFLITRLLFNNEAGLWASMLLSFSRLHIYHSQYARMYSLFFMLSLLTLYFTIRVIKSPKKRNFIFLLLSSIATLYTHNFGLLTITGCFIILIHKALKEKKLFLGTFITSITLFIAYIPWILVIISEFESVSWIKQPELLSISNTFHEFLLGHIQLFGKDGYLKIAGHWTYLSILLFPALILFALKILISNKNKFGLTIIISIFLFSFILPIILSFLFFPMFDTRFLLPASAVLYCLTAVGLEKITSVILKFGLAIIVFSGMMPSLYYHFCSDSGYEPVKQVHNVLQNNSEKTDCVLTHPYFINESLSYYNNERNYYFIEKQSLKDENLLVEKWFKKITDDCVTLWLIYGRLHAGFADPDDLMLEQINKYYNKVLLKDYNTLTLYLFSRKDHSDE